MTLPEVWQVGGGPRSRTYADLFLRYGVALIGPGDPGPWNRDRDDSDFGSGCVRRFADEINDGDILLLRTGQSTVQAIGLATGAYEYLPQFDDVNGWDLQHARRVRWCQFVEPFEFATPVFGANPSPTARVAVEEVVDFARRFLDSPPHDWQAQPVPELPPQEPVLEDVPNALTEVVARASDLEGVYWDRTAFGDHPTEDELVAHYVVPLMRGLGWNEEHIAVKWRYVDVAVFDRLPREPENCRFIIEAKRLGAGVEGALEQAMGYLQALGITRDIVVTDGIRYRMYGSDAHFIPTAYANLTRLKRSALALFEMMKRS